MTVKVIVHDLMVEVRPNGAGNGHLRQNVWLRSLKICRQSGINEPILEGTVGFKIPYKLQVVVQQETLGNLRVELLSFQVHMNHNTNY